MSLVKIGVCPDLTKTLFRRRKYQRNLIGSLYNILVSLRIPMQVSKLYPCSNRLRRGFNRI